MRGGLIVRTGSSGVDRNFDKIAREFERVTPEEISHTFSASANTEEVVSHGLGRVPTKAWLKYKDRACDIYDSGTAWTTTVIYLKCSVGSAKTIIAVE